MENFPPEILELIFVYLNYNIIIKVCKKWKNIAENIKKKFIVLNIDLFKVKIENLLIFDPEILNITCTQIYENLNTIYNKNNLQKYKNEEHIYINTFIEFFNNLKKFNKFTKLKTINISLDIAYFIKDINILKLAHGYYNYFNNENQEINIKKNTLCTFFISCILKIGAKNIYVKINEYNGTRNFICYEHYLRNFLMKNLNNFDIFIYDAPNGHYFVYNAKIKTLNYRIGDYRKYNIYVADEYINNITNRAAHSFFDDLKFQIIDLMPLKILKLDKLHIYSIYFDKMFIQPEIDIDFEIKEMKYFYFFKSIEINELNIQNGIYPYELEFINENNFENYNLKQ